MKVKFKITRYVEPIKEPPFLTEKVGEMEVEKPESDNLGEEFYNRISSACRSMGFIMKFYSSSKDEYFDYEVVVY